MLQSWKSGCCKLGLGISLALGGAIVAASGNCALAQIIPDSTLGDESSVVTPTNIDGLPTERIDGGATRGANLFHSFEQFSVLNGSAAHFNNASAIQNIISRVTGGSVSNIDGLIRANPSANLFLLNPNGIIFGQNARLDIGGSFLASTANSLRFADGTGFSATGPETKPLLTVSVPIGLQFGGGEGRILNQSVALGSFGGFPTAVGLQVQPRNTLALVGGNVALEGGILTAEEGRIELGSVAGPSLVSLRQAPQGWELGYEGVQNFRDIRLSQLAIVNATGNVGGSIQVQGRRVALTDGSQIVAFTVSGQGGTLSVNASDSVELTGSITVDNVPFFSSLRTDTVFGDGTAGDVRINTGNLLVRDRAFISAFTSYGSGQGGDLVVTASGSVEVDRGLLSVESVEGSGNAGNLTVTARSIRLNNQANLRATAGPLSSGNDGNITLQVQDLLLLRRNSQISTNVGGTPGNGGNISILTPFIVAVPSEDSDIRANASGRGGNAQITAQNIFGTQIRSKPTSESDINASGNVRLDTPTVFDPSRGLVTLPAELVDVSGLIVQGCPVGGGTVGRASEFIVIGRGGLPPTPREALGSEPALVDLGTPVQAQENRTSATTAINNPTSSDAPPLVEAQGWVIGSNGEVVLTAQAPSVTPHSPWLTPNNCHGS